MPSTAAEQLAHCTVHIVTELPERPNPATAFLLSLGSGSAADDLLLITNKHVIENSLDCSVFLSQMEDGKRSRGQKQLPLPTDLSEWICHPDKTIDLVAFPIRSHFDWTDDGNQHPLCRSAITEAMIPTAAELAAMPFASEILVIGYPNSLRDKTSNLPLFSKGIASTYPGNDFDGKPEFIIDTACCPGSSGSPVFSFQSVKDQAPKLLGVVRAGIMRPFGEELFVRSSPEAEDKAVNLLWPTNFAYAIGAEKLLGFAHVRPSTHSR